MNKGVEVDNRKASYRYQLLELLEVGIQLQGTEVKSIRSGNVNMGDAYCSFTRAELYLHDLHISEYKYGNVHNHEPMRPRKLLLKKSELNKWHKKVKERGYTIVPTKLYTNERGIIKVEIALAQGKKSFDKRQSIKERDIEREMDRRLREF